jgi:exonuclease III
MRFGTWNIRSLCRVGTLMIVSRELPRYRLDIVGVQEVRWEDSDTEPAGEYKFVYGKGMRNMKWVEAFLYIKTIISAVKGVRMLVIVCHT